MKKVHPEGLPHLADAMNEDGSVNHEAVAVGSEAWSAALASGAYTLIKVDEIALDEKHDTLIAVRRKND